MNCHQLIFAGSPYQPPLIVMAEVDNIPRVCLSDALVADAALPESNLIGTPNGPDRLALRKDAFWPNGKKLRVRFLNGTPFVQGKVRYYSQLWEKYGNVDFLYVASGPADIRVAFKWNGDGGSWSYVGTDSARFVTDQNKPTMNFGWFDENTRDEEFSRTTIHEFGHALGCIHEHQSPASTIKWNEAKVIADAKANWGWSEAQVRSNILNKYAASQTSNTAFDRNSIMCYYFPANWTLDGVGTPTNYILSLIDKSFIGKMYPFRTHNTGKFGTLDIRTWYPPVALNSRVIEFNPTYLEAPKLSLGLTELDMACGANIRVRVHAPPIDKRNGDNFTINLDSWADSSLYSAAATWVEFGAQETDFQVGEFDTLTERRIDQSPKTDADGLRRDIKYFAFPTNTYTEAPNVVVWLKALDISKDANWRIRALARNVTAKGFELSIESWADTRVYSAAASWVAYPKGREGVASGVVKTTDYRSWYPPVAENGARVKFATPFDKEPKVFLAISLLDMDSARNLRINTFADDVSADGFTWHANAWADTNLYQTGLDWIAFG